MYGNNNSSSNNNTGGYPPYGYNYKSSGGRNFGMSNSLPSGMDTEFSPSFPKSSRRGYTDFSGGGSGAGSSNSLTGGICNVAPTSSNNSLNLLGGNPGGGIGGGMNSASGSSGSVNNDPQRASATNLIVNYLPQDMTDRELYALFRTVGCVNTCRIMRDYKTGYSFGYAFVDYVTDLDSQRAIKCLNGITVRHKRLKVSYARPGGESIKDTNLYVTNLSRVITDDQLEKIFTRYGSIVQMNILRDKLTGKARGVAFVRYSKREEAQEAIAALNNIIPEGASQPLSVRLAEEHGKAKAAHFMSQMGMGHHHHHHHGIHGPPHMHHMNAYHNNHHHHHPHAHSNAHGHGHPHAHAHAAGGGGSGVMPAYNSMIHRADNFTDLLDSLYRKKSLQYPYL